MNFAWVMWADRGFSFLGGRGEREDEEDKDNNRSVVKVLEQGHSRLRVHLRERIR